MGLRFRFMARLWADAESAYRGRILEALPAPDSSARLLDVGCDDGAWTEEVRRRLGVPAKHVHAVEIVPHRADLARARGFDVRTVDLDARWPFEAGTFDVVHANQVIEHVTRLDHFVQEIKRMLRPRGRAIVCTENLASWHNVAALALGYQPFSLTNISCRRPIGNPFALHAGDPIRLESWQHVHLLSLPALREIFGVHGFAIDAAWGTGYHPLPGRLASRLAAVDPRHAHFIGIVARALHDRSSPVESKSLPPAATTVDRGRHSDRLLTVTAALYVLLPFDVIPDFIPIVGHFDDAIIVALVVQAARHQWLDKLCRVLRLRRLWLRPEAA